MYVCMYVCMCVCVCVHTHIYTYTHTHIHTYIGQAVVYTFSYKFIGSEAVKAVIHLGNNKKDPTLALILTNSKLCNPIIFFLIPHFQNIIPQSSTFHKFRRW